MEIQLPPEIQELVQSYDDNCCIVERRAVDTVSSFEIPVFNGLRDITARNCYLVLCSLPKWFGTSPNIEHCTCLVALTEYISCSYNNTDFYDTFVKSKQDKFYESFFIKLVNEWKKVFHKMPYNEFSSFTQFNYLRISLQKSFKRFPSSFMYNWMLHDIMAACEDFGCKFKLHSFHENRSKPLNATLTKEVNSSHVIQQSQITNFMTPHSCNKGHNKPVTLSLVVRNCNKVVQKVVCRNSVESQRDKIVPNLDSMQCKPNQAVQKPEPALSHQNEIRKPEVIVIDDVPSPAKKPCKTIPERNEVTHHAIPAVESMKNIDTLLKPIEHSLSNVQLNIRHDRTSDEPADQDIPLPKKVNAFDILMRRVLLKKKSIS